MMSFSDCGLQGGQGNALLCHHRLSFPGAGYKREVGVSITHTDVNKTCMNTGAYTRPRAHTHTG